MDPRADVCDGEGSDSCALNFGLELECENGVCGNRVLQRRAFVPTEAFKTADRGWGLRLLSRAAKGSLVEEYVGEVVEPGEFWKRFDATDVADPLYFCEFVDGLIIDATYKGSFARLINHACAPNARLQHRSVAGWRRVVVVMIEDGEAGDEVTVAYRLPDGVNRMWQRCLCGRKGCVSGKGAGAAASVVKEEEDVVVLSSGDEH
mmetsp:Transcript_61527/g.127145  ORF Transcript_61527/g.127145 Transcript_61527/m.127145 type:complete len:205 (+) Transcript_61527:1268-1882(+)